MTTRLPALFLGALAALCAGGVRPLGAQSWRTLDVSRQLHDSGPVRVNVRYGAGKLTLHAANTPMLYDMRLRYDAARAEPLHTFVAGTRTLELGIRKQNVRLRGGGEPAELRLDLARGVPLDLALELGAVEADLDLSGLRLSRLTVESGASDASLRFDTANAEPMRSLAFSVGAASLTALRLANANTENITVNAGVGNVDLDLSGDWRRDINLDVEVALGGVTVRLPSEVGVRVEMQKVLGSFRHDGLVKRGDAFYSENWDSAPRKLRIRTRTALGRFELDRS